MTDTIATLENMRKYEDDSAVLAFSPNTGETYSATPGDYFMLPEGVPLRDAGDTPMILVRRTSGFESVEPVTAGRENYETREIDRVTEAGPVPFYRLQVSGNASTKWLNVSADQLARIRTVLSDSE